MLPTTGSKITPAIRSPCAANASSRPATSLYCSTSVSRLVPAVTPGEFGTASVAAELPAATSKLSTWP